MIDAIICVKNPNWPIFKKCIKQLLKQTYLNNIFIVFPYNEKWFYYRDFYNEKIIGIRVPNHSSMNYAQYLAIQKAQSEYICLVDADVILGNNHFKELLEASKYFNAVVEGILTIKGSSSKISAQKYDLTRGSKGMGKFPNNILMKRTWIIDGKHPFIGAKDEYTLAQQLFRKGIRWLRFPQKTVSYHFNDYSNRKQTLWSDAGKKNVLQARKRTILKDTLIYLKRRITQSPIP